MNFLYYKKNNAIYLNFDYAINDEDYQRAKRRYEKQGFTVEKETNLKQQICTILK
jgi:hypothetical protein